MLEFPIDRKDRSWAHHHCLGRSMQPQLAEMQAIQLVKHEKDSCLL